jgi:DNA-binding response OmpR family regulator
MSSPHLLLAESRPNLQHSLSLMLKQAGYRVSLAASMKEAVVQAKGLAHTPERVALLIADLDSVSPEACAGFIHLLSTSTLALPYLVLTEEINGQTVKALKNHGCLACITKPFEPAILLRSVHAALNRASPQDGRRSGRKSEKNSSGNPNHQPGESLLFQGERTCKTNCCATGFHSCSLPRFW